MPSRLRHRFFSFNASKGFTLIELLIVLTILAALLMLTLINGPRFVTKARDSQRKSDLEAYKIAFEHFYEDKGCYPAAADVAGCGAVTPGLKPYLPKMLCDPQTRQPYNITLTGCASYKIFTSLDNADDPDIGRVGCLIGCGPGDPGAGPKPFNYGVSSTNVRVGEPGGYSATAGGSTTSSPTTSPTPTPSSSTSPGGNPLGNDTFLPLNCTQQPNGSWNCNCTAGAACGYGCPGNTVCAPTGTYCSVDPVQCPVGPQ